MPFEQEGKVSNGLLNWKLLTKELDFNSFRRAARVGGLRESDLWELRPVVGATFQSQLPDPMAQGIGMQPQNLGRPAWTLNHSARLI